MILHRHIIIITIARDLNNAYEVQVVIGRAVRTFIGLDGVQQGFDDVRQLQVLHRYPNDGFGDWNEVEKSIEGILMNGVIDRHRGHGEERDDEIRDCDKRWISLNCEKSIINFTDCELPLPISPMVLVQDKMLIICHESSGEPPI